MRGFLFRVRLLSLLPLIVLGRLKDHAACQSVSVDEDGSIAITLTATDGTFDLNIVIDGVPYAVADIDHDADAATIKAAILAATGLLTADLATADGGGGLGSNDGTCTLTWGGAMAARDVIITYDGTNITGNDHTFSTSTAGAPTRIDGFIWPDAVVLDADEEVLGQVMLGGRIHAGDLVASPDAVVSAVRAACANKQLRDSGFIFEGLVDFH